MSRGRHAPKVSQREGGERQVGRSRSSGSKTKLQVAGTGGFMLRNQVLLTGHLTGCWVQACGPSYSSA